MSATCQSASGVFPEIPVTREAILATLQRLGTKEGAVDVIGYKSVSHVNGRFYVEGHRQPMCWNVAVEKLLKQRRARS